MDIRNEIIELRNYLLIEATKQREEITKETTSYMRGLNGGYAGAYELCAKWITEILEG